MNISKNNWIFIEALTTNRELLTRHDLRRLTGHSKNAINKTMEELEELAYVVDSVIAPEKVFL